MNCIKFSCPLLQNLFVCTCFLYVSVNENFSSEISGNVVVYISGQVKEDEVVNSNIMPYWNIEQKQKKSLGEMEQDFLQALQVYN